MGKKKDQKNAEKVKEIENPTLDEHGERRHTASLCVYCNKRTATVGRIALGKVIGICSWCDTSEY